MEITKTYPPEVQQLLDAYQALIEQTAQQMFSPQPSSLTATDMIKSRPVTPEQHAKMQRDFHLAIDPIVKEMAKLESFATITMKVPR